MSTDDDAAASPDQTPAGWSDHAATYDDWLAPITRLFADDVVRVLRITPGLRVLDVAAGTGAFAIAAARVGAGVLATDFAPGMVDHLRRSLVEAGLAAVVEEMDGQALTVEDGRFDVAASLFGLIFFPDTAAGARELHRVLRPGGRAAVVAWAPDGLAVHPIALEAIARVGVAQPTRQSLPAAFRLSAPGRLEALLEGAGFHGVAVETIEHAYPIADTEALFRSIPSWSAPLRPVFDLLGPEQLRDAATIFGELVRASSGPQGLDMRALLATGRR